MVGALILPSGFLLYNLGGVWLAFGNIGWRQIVSFTKITKQILPDNKWKAKRKEKKEYV